MPTVNTQPLEFRAPLGKHEIVFKTGGFAQQAGGAVMAQIGESIVMVTATMSAHPREGIDFFPLSVDFEERMYAVGRIPGSFFRREGRPSESAILICRLTDRPLRPLFPHGMRNEVQVVNTPLSHDTENMLDILAINGASAALMVSDIPWNGPIGAVRIGLIGDEFIVNPTLQQIEQSELDLRVAATSEAIIMVECAANEIPEDQMLEALELAHASVQDVIALQLRMREEMGRDKRDLKLDVTDEVLKALHVQVEERVQGTISDILRSKFDKDDRNEAMDELRESVIAEYESLEDMEIDLKEVRQAISDNLKKQVRGRIAQEGMRPDGRDFATIRPLSAQVDWLPRAHGSGVFQRGETQVLSICTLGTPRDAQELDDLSLLAEKRYLHHYNFPPYSTGETYFLRGPKRREIGHGALAENALRPMIPDKETFPYTVRVVSEVLSSNGSTSMASVCGSTLSLMAAGVPLKRPVAGIAMGLIYENDEYYVLTDIQGMEDHIGDMDFKVAGTKEGITALQMDIKISGIPADVMRRAMEQAHIARMQILDVMLETMPEPRAELSPYAPRMEILKLDVEKIGAIIGPGGKTVREIQETTKTRIEIEEDGTAYVSGVDGVGTKRALEMIAALLEEPEVGRIYTGKVDRIESYGAFVTFLPGHDGMLHISQVGTEKIDRIEDEFQVGDEIMVMVTEVESGGRVRLSRQAVLEGWTLEEAQSRDRGIKKGGGGGGRGGGNRGGGNRGGGGSRSGSRRGGSNRN